MHEQGQVNGRVPRQRIPRHGPLGHRSLRVRHDALQHREELLRGNRRCPVEGHRAPSLVNDPVRRDGDGPGFGRWRPFRALSFRDRSGFVGDAPCGVPLSLFRRGFPGCLGHVIDDFPGDGVIPAQPVRLASPVSLFPVFNNRLSTMTERYGCALFPSFVRRRARGGRVIGAGQTTHSSSGNSGSARSNSCKRFKPSRVPIVRSSSPVRRTTRHPRTWLPQSANVPSAWPTSCWQ